MDPKALALLQNAATEHNAGKSDRFHALIYGEMGSGKTSILATAPRPILIHSFDPGGSLSIRDHIGMEKGVIVDSSFETDDTKSPTAFRNWLLSVQKLRASNVFEQIGTFCIDSLTTWSEAWVAWYLNTKRAQAKKDEHRSQLVMGLDDYKIQFMEHRGLLKNILSLPCNIIVTAHAESATNALTGAVEATIAATGKLRTYLPLLFDEILVSEASRTATGIVYELLTRPTARFRSIRSRLGAGNRFKDRENADIKELLKKAGFPFNDLSPLMGEEKGESPGAPIVE